MKTGIRARVPLPVLVAVLTIGAFTTALNVTILSPLLTAIANEFHVSESAAGQLATVTATCSGLTGLAVAPLLDRYPRGVTLRIEAALLGIGTLLSALAPNFALLFLGRALAGFGGAIIFGLSMAAAGDLFDDPAVRNKVIGILGTAATLGAVVGLPVLTELRAFAGWRWAVASLLPLVALLFVGTFLLPRTVLAPATGNWRHGWRSGYAQVLRHRPSVALLALMVATMTVWFGFLIYFGAYAEQDFDTSARTLSLIFLVGGLAEAVANNVVPPFLNRFPARSVIIVAGAVVSAALLATGALFRTTWSLFPFFAICSMGLTVLFFATSICLLDSLPSARGALMGLQSAWLEFGGALGAALTGVLLRLLGDYAASFRVLGLVLPGIFLLYLLAGRRLIVASPVPQPAAEDAS